MSPLITIFKSGINKSDIIIKYFTDIYSFEPNLIGYIIAGLANSINNVYSIFYTNSQEINASNNIAMTSDIIHSLTLMSLYDNTDKMWSLYFKNVSTRIKEQNKKNLLNHKIIDFELEIFNYLVVIKLNHSLPILKIVWITLI